MIIVRLQGGLGNQLFQYALAVGIKAKTGQEYLFDKSGLGIAKGVTPWPYMLDSIAIDVPLCTPEQSAEFQQEKEAPKRTKIKRLFGASVPRFVKEIPNRVNEEVFQISDDTYLDGYWQSEKYFKHIESEIRSLFTLKNPLSPAAQSFADQMNIPNSVSLHIRRGDYVEFKKVGDTLGICGPEYFKKAVDIIASRIEDPHLFIFSDDIKWAKTDLQLPFQTTYVSGNNIPFYEEMMLMSHCRHHILSNSSFSWWGAWLDAREDKIVIAPTPWFKDPKIENPDIVPLTWTRI